MCERCKNPNVIEVTTYTLTKADGSSRKATLCDACADVTRSVHKLTGGKAPEAKPSAPEPAAVETEPDPVVEAEPELTTEAPARRRRY